MPSERAVLRALLACKTAELGAHRTECKDCGRVEQSYNSCRNRHCPKCQGSRAASWSEDREAELLPVPYFHLVFTLPHELGSLALGNKEILYDLLFRAAKRTLLKIGENNFGLKIGFFLVLHTWGQKLDLHPHLHCVIPAGGIAADGSWKNLSGNYFCSVKILSSVFRGKFIEYLKRAKNKEELRIPDCLKQESAFERFLSSLCKTPWVVYVKPPFSGPRTVIRYLSRYTHKTAISNSRLLALKDSKVSFSYKDYRRGVSRKVLTLNSLEFIRRFFLHLLPKGFVRIRYCGFMANCSRKAVLASLQKQFKIKAPKTKSKHRRACSYCGSHRVVLIVIIKTYIKYFDSS
jgi:hypothetical protein